MKNVPVNPATLERLLQLNRQTPEEIARRLRVPLPRVRAWLAGEDRPTYRQARALAKALKTGIPQLLTDLPELALPLPDLRRPPHPPDWELLQVVWETQRKAEWFASRTTRLSEPGKLATANPGQAQNVLLAGLGLTGKPRFPSPLTALKWLVSQVESRGFLVVQPRFDPGQFRGLVLADPYPVIAVSGVIPPEHRVGDVLHGLLLFLRGQTGVYREQDSWVKIALPPLYQTVLAGTWEPRPRAPYTAFQMRHSPRFTHALTLAFQAGEVDAKEAACLLGVSLRQAWSFLTRVVK